MEQDQEDGQFEDPVERIDEIREKLLALSNHEVAFCQRASQFIEHLRSSTELANKLNHDARAKQEAMHNNVNTFTTLKLGS